MENIEDWLRELKKSGKTIIVEGPNDKKALEYFGITNVVTLSRKPLFQIIEEVAEQTNDVIILTDFDKKGKELYGKLSKGLNRLGCRVENRFRLFMLRSKLSHVEGLVSYVHNP